jgi:hypothetical protein
MLGEYETQLIAAAVDGELSAEESRALTMLLSRSPAAVELHIALLRDRDRLAALPRNAAPASLVAAIADAIANSPRTELVRKPDSLRRPRWVPAALAASVLVAVASGTYWIVAESAAPRLVKRQIQQLPKDGSRLVPPVVANRAAEPEQVESNVATAINSAVEPKTADQISSVATNDEKSTNAKPVEPILDPERILAAPVGSDVKAFDRVDLKLPLLVPLADFANDDAQAALKLDLTRNPATRIDAFVKDSAKAAEALVASAKKLNLNLQIETVAGERLKRRMPSVWWIYTEALTPDEIAKWMGETAAAEAALASPSERTFGNIHAIPAGVQDQKDSLALAGVDLGLGKKPAAPSAHISSKTIDQVAGTLQKGETTKPGILLTYLPPLVRVHPQLSKDIKQFNELRVGRRPDTVPLVIVVRPVQ